LPAPSSSEPSGKASEPASTNLALDLGDKKGA
jgi:hypothetical protein